MSSVCKCANYQTQLLYFIYHRYIQSVDNSTDDLEVRVTLLEDDVSDLETDVEEIRTYITFCRTKDSSS